MKYLICGYENRLEVIKENIHKWVEMFLHRSVKLLIRVSLSAVTNRVPSINLLRQNI